MSRYKKRKLKTLDELELEFKDISDEWDYSSFGNLYIIYKDMRWIINKEIFKYFGTEIEVRKVDYSSNYTHVCREKEWYWHELMFKPEFEPIEFLSIDEVLI